MAKRMYLLNSLGIPLSLLPHISICEFGPGTGQNAKVLIEQGAVDLSLVDASDKAIESLRKLKDDNMERMNRLDIVKANFWISRLIESLISSLLRAAFPISPIQKRL